MIGSTFSKRCVFPESMVCKCHSGAEVWGAIPSFTATKITLISLLLALSKHQVFLMGGSGLQSVSTSHKLTLSRWRK
jgi:hypothetical protein